MMLKTVYGPPPADAERIEATDLTMESSIQEEEAEETTAASPAERKRKKRKGAEGQ